MLAWGKLVFFSFYVLTAEASEAFNVPRQNGLPPSFRASRAVMVHCSVIDFAVNDSLNTSMHE